MGRSMVRGSAVLLCLVLVALVPGPGSSAGGAGGEVYRAVHEVAVGGGVTLHVVEAWSDATLADPSAPVLLTIAPTLVTHKVWDADVPDDPTYSALYMAASEGYYAYAFDHWGYGDSSKPENGMDVTFERMLEQTTALFDWVRARTGASEVDLLSGSLGNSIAVALGATGAPTEGYVGRIVTTANVYANASLVLSATILNPAVCSVLPPPPDGYTTTLGPEYSIILWNAEPALQVWAYQAFPGTYAQGPTQEGCDLPVFPAALGRAPVLVAYGDHDLLATEEDVQQFANEYGGEVELLFLPGGGHAPPFEAVRHDFWDATFAWLAAS